MSNVPLEAINALLRVGKNTNLNKKNFFLEDFEFLNVSFSLAGEDLILRKIFKPKLISGAPGFYVDIGASDPRNGSNTYLFYCHNWNGICIDANQRFVEAYPLVRPRDIFVHAAVSASKEPLFFYSHKTNHGMSMVRNSQEQYEPEFEAPVPIAMRTLEDILTEHVPDSKKIDFMSVDIEDSELSAFESGNWKKFRPEIILFETNAINPNAPLEYPTVSFLLSQGYQFEMLIFGSVIMRSVESKQ